MALRILCFETYWSDGITDRRLVRPLLDLIETNVPGVAARHAHVADRKDFSQYLAGAWSEGRYGSGRSKQPRGQVRDKLIETLPQ